MASRLTPLLATVAVVIALLAAWGALDIKWPWESLPEIATNETTISYDAPPRIVEIEPIALDCRARIHAEVPVEGREDHRLFGATYRTDSVTMLAVGDVDTCVDPSAVSIESTGLYTDVTVRGDQIEFVRPRVDAAATQNSVQFDKGFVGKLTDAFPWVSDNSGLTPAAYSFAQTVIGGSDCMTQAFEVTQEVLADAYREQATARGIDPETVRVQIIGTPDFAQNETAAEIGDFDFATTGDESVCEVADAPNSGVEQPEEPVPAPHTDIRPGV
jgi:hypothetical protein